MRAFIAIDFSDDIKSALDRAVAHLKYSGADVKWVAKDNVHLTLKFLGEIDEKKLEAVKSILDTIGSQTPSFEVALKGLGAFPKIEYPRVIWAGIDKGSAELKVVAKKLDEALFGIGFQKETRPFAAHLTIGRVRSPKNKTALKEKLETYELPCIPAHPIDSIILYKSALTPRGSIYTILHKARLLSP